MKGRIFCRRAARLARTDRPPTDLASGQANHRPVRARQGGDCARKPSPSGPGYRHMCRRSWRRGELLIEESAVKDIVWKHDLVVRPGPPPIGRRLAEAIYKAFCEGVESHRIEPPSVGSVTALSDPSREVYRCVTFETRCSVPEYPCPVFADDAGGRPWPARAPYPADRLALLSTSRPRATSWPTRSQGG